MTTTLVDNIGLLVSHDPERPQRHGAALLIDDGVVARLAPDRFHVTTTTGGAGRVLHMMEDYLQTEWSELQVWLTSITEQWAVIAVQGPNARRVIEPLVDVCAARPGTCNVWSGVSDAEITPSGESISPTSNAGASPLPSLVSV